jgi:chromosome segregation ATPase
MSEILFKGEAENGAAQVDEQVEETGSLALSADEFSALEDRILRAVELVKRERQARAAAEDRATQAATQLGDLNAHVERMERDVKQLRAERDHVRERVDKLLKQLDSLEL